MADNDLEIGLHAETTGQSDVNALAGSVGALAERLSSISKNMAGAARYASALEKQIALTNRSSRSAATSANSLAASLTAQSRGFSSNNTAISRMVGAYNTLNKAQISAANGGKALFRDINTGKFTTATKAAQQYAAALSKVKSVTGNAARSSALGGTAAYASATPVTGLKLGGAGLNAFNSQAKSAANSVRQLQLQTKAAGDQGALLNKQFAFATLGYEATRVGKELLGIGLAAFQVSADYQAAFANVQRTTQTSGKEAVELKNKLIDLSTEVPHTFEDIAAVAALGGQLGVASSGVVDFTRVVTKLKLTTDLTYEAAGTAIGRISQLLGVPSSQFENLASSILKVGINSVATESQIVKTANNLASIGNLAGLSAPQVIGLSGALASLGIPPELARGTFEQLFTRIADAADGGGDHLATFARLSGISAQEFADNWESGNAAKVQTDLTAFFVGLGKEGSNARNALADLNITSVRYVPTLLKLAQNTDVYKKALKDAISGYVQNTELAAQYQVRTETLSAKLIELGNVAKKFLNNIGSASLAPLGAVTDALKSILDGLAAFGNTKVGGVILTVVAGLTALAGVALVVLGTVGQLVAGIVSLQVALGGMFGGSTAAAIGVGRLGAVELEATAASAGMAAATAALAAGLSAEAAAAEYAAASTAVYNTQVGLSGRGKAATAIAAVGEKFATLAARTTTATGAISAFGSGVILGGVVALGLGLTAVGNHFKEIRDNADIAASGVKRFNDLTAAGKQASPSEIAAAARRATQNQQRLQASSAARASKTSSLSFNANQSSSAGYLDNAGYKASAQAIKNLDTQLASLATSGGGKQATKVLNDLNGVIDTSGSNFPKYSKAIADYNAALMIANGTNKVTPSTTKGVAEAYNEIVKATQAAVKSITEFNSVAAGNANAQIAYEQAVDDVSAAIAKSGRAAIGASGNFDLTQQSGRDAASALIDLASKGNAAAGQLLNAGGSADEVTKSVNKTRAQVTALAKGFGLSGQALQDFVNKYVQNPSDLQYTLDVSGVSQAQAQLNELTKPCYTTIFASVVPVAGSSSGAPKPGGKNGVFAEGGYTGPGRKNDIAGIVHAGEVVFSQKDIKNLGGVANVMALRNNGAMPASNQRTMVASAASRGSGYTTLDPAQVQQIVRGLSVNVMLDNKAIAGAANAANLDGARRGANG